jgi:exodeoxyribonuclease V beta subunit
LFFIAVSVLSLHHLYLLAYNVHHGQLNSAHAIAMPQNICQPMRPNIFNLARSPLEGFNLIDASAGTGKTYTICGLVLRLLLEKELPIEQILVVTYTEAATEDLRDRIRQKLRQALDAINTPPGDDEFLQEYIANLKDCKAAAQRLSEALRSFDAAAIYTIHGFCQRTLIENSFESNTLFDTELITDDSNIIKEIVEDFWRRNFSSSSQLFSQYAASKLTPDALHDFLIPFMPHPFLKFIPDIEFASGCNQHSDTEAEYLQSYRTVCQAWAAARHEVSLDLLQSQVLNRAIYKKASIPVIINYMDDMAAACLPSPRLFDRFVLLTGSRITSGTKAKKTPNILPFYQLCENLVLVRNNLLTQYDRCLLALKKRLLDSFRDELALRKARDNVFSFDDLLQKLHKALSGPGGSAFARTVARKYPAVLIDEFQDTDPLQFEIFKSLYTERSLLFLIGDPKQAIYSFRGADVFTYMDAAADSPLAHHTLGVNHRSTPKLIKAVNAIFCRAQKPFIFEAISFQPVNAAPKKNPEYLTIDGKQREPFILWYLGRIAEPGGGIPASPRKNPRITKTAARSRIISQVAAEVCRLLNLASENRIRINGRKLLPGDIAILVRKNDEARKMQQALTELYVPSVLHSSDDLFASEEAQELSLLLNAIAVPNNIRRVKSGLLTRFIGLQANVINQLQVNCPESEGIIEGWLTKFRTYHTLWTRYGFIQMFWALIRENRVRQRLLASENGERSLTNILHLAEILQQETANKGLNMTGLIGFLHERLASHQGQNIEHQLRLESDEDRVRIVTIHKAKGLEFPVVFCPFTWEGLRSETKRGCLFHLQDAGEKTALVFDAGSPELEKHLQRARQEEMAENLRLLYVALTRAVHRCYLFWGPFNGAETSAPAYLLHQGPVENTASAPAVETENTLMQKVAARFLELSDHEILTDLQDLAAASQGTIRISGAEELLKICLQRKAEQAIQLRYRKFTGVIASDWRISSFSSLTASRSIVTEGSQALQDKVLDRDEIHAGLPIATAQPEEKNKAFDIFSFPHGARPGIFLHELLEQADFSNEHPVQESVIYEKLRYFGYEASWYPVIAQLLENLGNVLLHNDFPDLKLSNVPRAACLHELEFYFPHSRLTPDAIKRIFCRQELHGTYVEGAAGMGRQLDRLRFAPARGYMRGFIDLVFEFENKFYLVDWKSNFLGFSIANYRQDKLAESMLSGFYFLQYHIYCLALHLYLQKRLPGYRYESHFGGVFYVFLRGIKQNLGPDYGIFHDLPDLSTIKTLHAKFLAGETT